MYLNLDNIPTVINACFVLQNLCEYHNMHIDEDLVKIQIKAAKKKIIITELKMLLTQFTPAMFLQWKYSETFL